MKAQILSYPKEWWMYIEDDRPIIGETMTILPSLCPLYDYKCYDIVSKKIYWFKNENLDIVMPFDKEEFDI